MNQIETKSINKQKKTAVGMGIKTAVLSLMILFGGIEAKETFKLLNIKDLKTINFQKFDKDKNINSKEFNYIKLIIKKIETNPKFKVKLIKEIESILEKYNIEIESYIDEIYLKILKNINKKNQKILLEDIDTINKEEQREILKKINFKKGKDQYVGIIQLYLLSKYYNGDVLIKVEVSGKVDFLTIKAIFENKKGISKFEKYINDKILNQNKILNKNKIKNTIFKKSFGNVISAKDYLDLYKKYEDNYDHNRNKEYLFSIIPNTSKISKEFVKNEIFKGDISDNPEKVIEIISNYIKSSMKYDIFEFSYKKFIKKLNSKNVKYLNGLDFRIIYKSLKQKMKDENIDFDFQFMEKKGKKRYQIVQKILTLKGSTKYKIKNILKEIYYENTKDVFVFEKGDYTITNTKQSSFYNLEKDAKKVLKGGVGVCRNFSKILEIIYKQAKSINGNLNKSYCFYIGEPGHATNLLIYEDKNGKIKSNSYDLTRLILGKKWITQSDTNGTNKFFLK